MRMTVVIFVYWHFVISKRIVRYNNILKSLCIVLYSLRSLLHFSTSIGNCQSVLNRLTNQRSFRRRFPGTSFSLLTRVPRPPRTREYLLLSVWYFWIVELIFFFNSVRCSTWKIIKFPPRRRINRIVRLLIYCLFFVSFPLETNSCETKTDIYI